MSDLDTLIPAPVELTVGGETLLLKPLKVGQMPAFLRAISPVLQQLTKPEIDWLLLFGERGHDLLSAIAIAVGGFMFLGDGLRDLWDPQLRGRGRF